MRNTDIAIVGGGLAGSLAAVLLGRAGIDALLVDPHRTYPEDFRCEKFDASQIALLERTGLADAVMPALSRFDVTWIASHGHVLDKRRQSQAGFPYELLVNTVRGLMPRPDALILDKATAVATGPERQTVQLASGETISARLVVLANGLNSGLRHALGIRSRVASPAHSISIGFDVAPVGRARFPFEALTYYPETPGSRVAYLSFFPSGATTRANLFVYRDMRDPWLTTMRHDGKAALAEALPLLTRVAGPFEIASFVKIRPVDLYVSEGHRQAGVVLAGDAFATSCPAAGNGTNKVLNDIERLCSLHIPAWLATPGMAADKLAAFYDDPVKAACDAACSAQAYRLRSMSIDPALPWRARRIARFVRRFGLGALSEPRERLAEWLSPATPGTPAAQ